MSNITKTSIARDVIKYLDSEKIIAESGIYFCINDKNLISDMAQNPETEFNQDLPKAKECEVCAIGALFYSTVLEKDQLNNKTALGGHWPDQTVLSIGSMFMFDYLKDYFTFRELAVIEAAFECALVQNGEIKIDDEIRAAISFGLSFEEDRDRMRAIMENIIEHREFKPGSLSSSDFYNLHGRYCPEFGRG